MFVVRLARFIASERPSLGEAGFSCFLGGDLAALESGGDYGQLTCFAYPDGWLAAVTVEPTELAEDRRVVNGWGR